jgi:hypothetical protein
MLAQTEIVELASKLVKGGALLGDAIIHHCDQIHHSPPNTNEHSRLGLLLGYCGTHTQSEPLLNAAYAAANFNSPV